MSPALTRPNSTWSRLVRFLPAHSTSPTPLVGEPVDPTLDIGRAVFEGRKVEVNVYSGSSILAAGEKVEGKVETIGTLLAPVGEDEVGTIRCEFYRVPPPWMQEWENADTSGDDQASG
jgi:hypothetical protein